MIKLLSIFAILVLNFSSFSFAKDNSPILSWDGYGPVKFGGRLEAIEKILGEHAIIDHDGSDNDSDCQQVKFPRYKEIEFMVQKGIIVRADGFVKNSMGLSANDNRINFLSQYSGKVCSIDNAEYNFTVDALKPFAQRQCSLIIFSEADNGFPNLVFINKYADKAVSAIEYDGIVHSIRAGLLPYVQYKEGCF